MELFLSHVALLNVILCLKTMFLTNSLAFLPEVSAGKIVPTH